MKNIIYCCIVTSYLLTACTQDLLVDSPTADFTLMNPREMIGDTLIFHLGDTCKFGINGYADNISFWSGTMDHRYDLRDREDAVGKIIVSFTSQAQWGSELNTLRVYAITNLPSLDSATVVNAEWKDITDRTALSVTGNNAVATGQVDITDLISSSDDVLYIGFRYTSIATSGSRRTWTITNYTVNNVGEDFNALLGNLANDASQWTRYGNVWNPANRRWTATTSSLTIVGGNQADPNNDSWMISKPMFVGRIAPEVLTATVKNVTGSADYYEYQYGALGSYKATFVFFNHTTDDMKSGVKQFNVKVIEE